MHSPMNVKFGIYIMDTYTTVNIIQRKTILVVTCNVAYFFRFLSVNQLLPSFTEMLSLIACMGNQLHKDK